MSPNSIVGLLVIAASVAASAVSNVVNGDANQSILDVYVLNGKFGHHSQRSLDLYQSPLILLAPVENSSGEYSGGLVAFYADNGLRSVVDYKNFEPLFQLLRSNQYNYGLVLNEQALKDNTFGQSSVKRLVFPENFRLVDLLRDTVSDNVPVLYVAPKEVFNSQRFVRVYHAARFVLDDNKLDPSPFAATPEVPDSTAGTSGVGGLFPLVTNQPYVRYYPLNFYPVAGLQNTNFNPHYKFFTYVPELANPYLFN